MPLVFSSIYFFKSECRYPKVLSNAKGVLAAGTNTSPSFTKWISFIVILLGFLTGFYIRLYYYNFYRDIIEVSHVCDPIVKNNITIEKQCGDVEVDCPKCPTCPDNICEVENVNCNCG